MTSLNIAHQRLYNQHISRATFEKPSDVVAWFGAVQAQDYVGALWAIGLRMRQATESSIEQAIADKTLVRTWPMRGTLHFVAAADSRWMLELLMPRVAATTLQRLELHYELDNKTISRSKDLVVRALQGGRQLRRDAIYKLLEAARIPTAGGRGLHILWRLAHDYTVCFGTREGKHPTFTLLDEWAPDAKRMERDAALAELARRYFTSHGPAALPDFIWWSGLKTNDAKTAVELAKPHLVQEMIANQPYWLAPSAKIIKADSRAAYLLPSYDEYTVAYKDRSAVLAPKYANLASSRNGIFSPIIVIDSQVVGTWKRTVKKDGVRITPNPFTKFSKTELQTLAPVAKRYGEFLGASVGLA
jgi:hypothetical protein